jgi:hypothetical protein
VLKVLVLQALQTLVNYKLLDIGLMKGLHIQR